MSNTLTLVCLFLVFYVVPLLLAAIHRTWLKIYFAVVFAAVLLLGYQTYVALETEEDCRAGCAIAISIMMLIIATAVVGSLLAMLSVSGFRKWRNIHAVRSRPREPEKAVRTE
mgnify:CR=1 FL=1